MAGRASSAAAVGSGGSTAGIMKRARERPLAIIEQSTVELPFFTPTGPDATPIIEMHRGHEGYIAFLRREADGGLHPIFNVPAKELGSVFPAFVAPHVDEESFFSVNGMYRKGYSVSKIQPKFTSAKWGTKELKRLCAAYVDIDCYNIGITAGQAIGVVVDAQDRGIIPPASMLTRSGRGIWCWWFLHDEDDHTKPARAWPENIATYRRIERALGRLFASIEPDRGATDPARVTRVPGSLHRMAQVRVGYWIQRDTSGRPFVYSLDSLAVRLGVAPARLKRGMERVLNPKRAEAGRRGYRALWAKRMGRLVNLIAGRGKIQEGCRNRCALLLAVFMQRCKIEEREIDLTVWNFGMAQCTPRLTDEEITEAIDKRHDYTAFSDFTIADWLKITPEEANTIGWPAAGSRTAADDSMLRTRSDARNARRRLIRELIGTRTGHAVPTLVQIAQTLEEMGIDTCTATIRKDLAAMGIVNTRGWRKNDPTPELIDTRSGEVLNGSIEA